MRRIKQLFLNNQFILVLILLNTITIFSEGFHELPEQVLILLGILDAVFTVLFLLEATIKIHHFSASGYFKSNWNRLDFTLVILSLPSLLLLFDFGQFVDLSFILALRVSRVFKFFRFFNFIPGIKDLAIGVRRALKTSVVIILGYFVYNFVIAIFSHSIFKDLSPEFFGDPATSFYSIFRIFTVEGWHEIPDKMTDGETGLRVFFIKVYFVFLLLTGGVFGLSLVNSIFVDSMVSDNNEDLERKIDILTEKIEKLSTQANGDKFGK
ncbi:MAG: ion transporter [Bacteroidota bacterium]|nr:ion transporter [Bacteroidota bacterium]